MNKNSDNDFFRFDPLKFLPAANPEQWIAALEQNAGLLGKDSEIFYSSGWKGLLEFYFGEEQFGKNRYRLSALKKAYYHIKPIVVLSSMIHAGLKRHNVAIAEKSFPIRWPIEDRFVKFLLHSMLQVNNGILPDFWPGKKVFAVALTHDVETEKGYRNILKLAEIEKERGFRSCFNLVPERYPIDTGLIQDLLGEGFEVGLHGLIHDGKLFFSKKIFDRRAVRINHYLKHWHACGFRSPINHRNPQWLQALEIDYDSSFFDTDPYEPMPGGVMSIWPYFIGHFVELPYTLPQDSTLFISLGQTTIDIWKQKLDWISRNHGMAMINVHPDYIDFNTAAGKTRKTTNGGYPLSRYTELLDYVKEKGNFWHVLPKEIAAYWRSVCI